VRIVVVGAGGVGAAAAAIARRRGFFARMVLADVDRGRTDAAVARLGDDRLRGRRRRSAGSAAGRTR
jgi:threonine dehydrogenase-like Zn-dependent dehydrogenase